MSESINTIYGAPTGQDARILADRARAAMREDRVICHIALDDNRAHTLESLLQFFAPDIDVLIFPAWDCLPYDRVSPSAAIAARRAATLCKLLAWEQTPDRAPRILITTVNAALQRVSPKSLFDNAGFSATKGSRINVENLQAYLTDNGYTRTDTVREAGEYSIRGGIIDIFPPEDENPVRFDLFGDEVETIRSFDPLSQRSLDPVKHFALTPVNEFHMDETGIQNFRSGYRDHFGLPQGNDPLYENISQGRRYNGMEHWLPLFFDQMCTLFDYIPAREISFDLHVRRSHTERLTHIEDFYQARKTLENAANRKKGRSKDVSLSGGTYRPLPPSELYLEEKEWLALTHDALSLSPFKSPSEDDEDSGAVKGRNFSDIRALPDGNVFAALKDMLAGERKRTLIACYSHGARERIKTMMEGAGFDNLTTINDAAQFKKLQPYQIGLSVLPLEDGFDAPDLRIVTEQDLLGDRLARASKKRRKADDFITEISSLQAGDCVVHVDHGIGRFLELETIKAGKTLHDCLKIEYAGGDKLFVPVENIEVLSRFGDSESTVQLDKLGGAGWQARKAKAKKDLMAMADHLLKIAAARQLKKAPSLHISEGLYNEFAARFPYNETEDQLRAINNAIADMGKTYPMDRLVCGDVGFGKTEVAIRAAYVAAMNGAQVAIIAPTTLLARQHYKNFTDRFAGTDLRIEQFSRLVGAADLTRAKKALADGDINIAIGTHSLFGNTIKFADLGLVIIDEEQRFGVKQKERLKELKENVHILTLTATPIPRTLQMALTGVKEMSLIATPPVDRLAVRTFVLPYDPVVIREALLREHYRGGQSFYVCPRIKDMEILETALKEIVPEIKVVTAHGQMPPAELEDRMNAFYDGQYGLLLATNIIESGIDIPTANTMIIHRADMFGLAQLYQIRGRIGRSKQRAYAYLTYPDNVPLGDTALKRLEIMETLDTLGAGFQLASHDMDIRGAGNLLGDKQSGHIKEVGVELYQQMLEDAVAAAREGLDYSDDDNANDTWSPQINLGTSVLIPETYVKDLGARMSLYRRLGELENAEEIDAFAAEMIDRFGDLPDEVNNLLEIISIKRLCRAAGIGQIDAGPKGAVIAFHNNAPPNVEGLMNWITSKRGIIKLRPDQKLSLIKQYDSAKSRVKGIKSIIQEMAKL
ncbi:MAG: transcription-repair coupling factor [Alphaproteobacteria bacterium]|nr:transcription-repair coupling factor [Alphaproteobacteria bacterium]|tara:strand:+ start:10276 stop:13755 length:3480 start_codon:yes stop_codon:yes gene_type:complete